MNERTRAGAARHKARALVWAAGLLTASWAAEASAPCAGPKSAPIPVTRLKLVERESGPVNYYRVAEENGLKFVRAEYKPPYKTAVLGVEAPEAFRADASHLSWSWRALKLPKGASECKSGKSDSAAVVYVTWKRGLRWYSLKYVWSSSAPKGSVCERKRNPFVAQDTVVLQTGAGDGWQHEKIDLNAEFRKHFEDGDPKAEVPDFAGFAIMSDGDQTESESSADYANFVLTASKRCTE